MSRCYMVVRVTPDENGEVDGQPAEVFMRFTEEPSDEFLSRLANEQPSKRVYCLLGASTYYEAGAE